MPMWTPDSTYLYYSPGWVSTSSNPTLSGIVSNNYFGAPSGQGAFQASAPSVGGSTSSTVVQGFCSDLWAVKIASGQTNPYYQASYPDWGRRTNGNYWTIDAIVLQGAANAGLGKETSIYNGGNGVTSGPGGATQQFLITVNGSSVRFYVQGSDGASTPTMQLYVANFFGNNTWQHVRMTIDYVNGVINCYGGPAGTVPPLLGSFAIPSGTWTLGTQPLSNGYLGFGPIDGVHGLRMTTGIKTDAHPVSFGAPVNLPTLTAAISGSNLILTASRAMLNTVNASNIANYTINVPAGSTPVTVTSAVVGSNTVTLSLSGDQLQGGAYSVAVPSNTIRAADTGEGNATSTVTFTGVATLLPAITSVVSKSSNTVAVTFNKAVRQVSSTNSDDALNPANYSIPTLTVNNVTKISSSQVLLTHTPSETPGALYNLTASGVKDLAGNSI